MHVEALPNLRRRVCITTLTRHDVLSRRILTEKGHIRRDDVGGGQVSLLTPAMVPVGCPIEELRNKDQGILHPWRDA